MVRPLSARRSANPRIASFVVCLTAIGCSGREAPPSQTPASTAAPEQARSSDPAATQLEPPADTEAPVEEEVALEEGSAEATARARLAEPAAAEAEVVLDQANGVGSVAGGTGIALGHGSAARIVRGVTHVGGGTARGRVGPPRPDGNGPPQGRMNREEYDDEDPNPFIAVADQPLSTFSADVDTASYSNVRRFLKEGRLPPPSAVRIEEMLNYFRYAYPEPEGEHPFGVHSEVAPCPWADGHRLVHIGLRTESIPVDDIPPRNLVFLLDVSGSMTPPQKLPLLKDAMRLLVDQLRAQDRVAIVVYAGASGLVLPSTSGNRRGEILAALERLRAGGSTNGAAGIQLAYRIAERHREPGAINRVILATDGDFNVGVSSRGELASLIAEKRKSGIQLTVLGFGTGNLRDGTMEMLADKGNGNYAYIDSIHEARKVLVREAGATLATVASDVKLQVEFNPQSVARYRLLGYENRLLAARDFNDDKKDAGEVGAGHMVTALYEVEPTPTTDGGSAGDVSGRSGQVDPLRYQSDRSPTAAASSGEMLMLKVRYKPTSHSRSVLFTRPVRSNGAGRPSEELRFATAVAGFGLWLRRDPEWSSPGLDTLIRHATAGLGRDPHGDRHELVALMRRAARLPR